MGSFTLGALTSVPASQRPDLLVATPKRRSSAWDLLDQVGVVEIDPAVSDTAATQETFGLDSDMLANCVVVGGKREGAERLAACVVLATTRADVNGAVRRYLDVRKASFLPMERAVALTGMEYGGITPIGLPAGLAGAGGRPRCGAAGSHYRFRRPPLQDPSPGLGLGRAAERRPCWTGSASRWRRRGHRRRLSLKRSGGEPPQARAPAGVLGSRRPHRRRPARGGGGTAWV